MEQYADMRRWNFGFEAIYGSQAGFHICGGKAKTGTQISIEILKDSVEEKGDSVIQLQSHKGGKPTEVTAGIQKMPQTSRFTYE